MFVKTFIFNPIQVNTYVVIDETTNECVVIDAGCLDEDVKNTLGGYIRNHQLQLRHVLNTHLHMDHCFGNRYLFQTFGVGPEASAEDEPLLATMQAQAAMFGIEYTDAVQPLAKYLNENDIIRFGNASLKVIQVPGHSRGGLAFYSESDRLLFSGDTLFHHSIGRTDLPGGDYKVLITSLIQKLMILPGETEVYCGHGPVTTIGDEREDNPYL